MLVDVPPSILIELISPFSTIGSDEDDESEEDSEDDSEEDSDDDSEEDSDDEDEELSDEELSVDDEEEEAMLLTCDSDELVLEADPPDLMMIGHYSSYMQQALPLTTLDISMCVFFS